MADFVLSERDGWEEIEEADGMFGTNVREDLWRALGQGDVDRALKAVHFGLQYAWETGDISDRGEEILERIAGLENVRGVMVPDDMAGEVMRIWVKWRPGPKDWRPGRRRT